MSIIVVNPSKEVPMKRTKYMGRVYQKDGFYYCVRKCNICGQWITWRTTSLRVPEVKNCRDDRVVRRERGMNSECRDWEDIRKAHQVQKAIEREETINRSSVDKFFKLLRQGKIK